MNPLVYQIHIDLTENDCVTLFTFFDDSLDTRIQFDEQLGMLHVRPAEDHRNFYLEEIMNPPGFDEQAIFKRNPFDGNSEEVFLNVVCPFWKYSETNRVRGLASFLFWDNLPVHFGGCLANPSLGADRLEGARADRFERQGQDARG